jgi:ADP-heptose:LPS heptosyltransferase
MKIKQYIKSKTIKRLARIVRKAIYSTVDLVGNIMFFLLRIVSRTDVIDKKINKILVIRLDRIGDLVLSTPAFRALKETFPEAEIHLLINEYTKDVVVENPNIDKLLIFGKDRIKNDYDLAIALHPGFKQNFYTFLSGAQIRRGYSGWGGSFFLTKKFKDDRDVRIRHEVVSALEVCGLDAYFEAKELELEISLTEAGESFAAKYDRINNISGQKAFVLIHPGARQEYIRWRKEGFAELADKLIEKDGANVMFLQGPGEEELMADICGYMKQETIVVSGLKLTETISLINRAEVFVGNSTGTTHMASALQVPVVAVFGNIHPLDSFMEWGPWGDNNAVVHVDPGCRRCHPGDCREFKCMEMVTSDIVYEVVKEKLNGQR